VSKREGDPLATDVKSLVEASPLDSVKARRELAVTLRLVVGVRSNFLIKVLKDIQGQLGDPSVVVPAFLAAAASKGGEYPELPGIEDKKGWKNHTQEQRTTSWCSLIQQVLWPWWRQPAQMFYDCNRCTALNSWCRTADDEA
jgi:hypothetical protein